MVFRSITKTVVIEARPQKVFSFLVDASNWHLWAIVNVLSVSPGDGRWWHMKTLGKRGGEKGTFFFFVTVF